MLSLIIITYNSAAQLGACLRAVGELRTPPEFEVIVVDNASSDRSAAVAAEFPGVRVVAERQNWGFAGGVNRGVRVAKGEIIALLNPDATPQPHWLEELIAPLSDSQIGVVGSKVLGPDGRIQSVGSILQQPVLLSAHRGDGEVDKGQYDEITDVWSVHGAAMAFQREVWDALGGLSEDYFPAYWEESDFCERARGKGYRVVVAPRAVVRHSEATTTGKYSPEFYYYYHRNRLAYLSDHFEWRYIWDEFRLAEHARLATAPLLDRRMARLVYTHGVPPLAPLDDARRAAILATGRALREGKLPDDGVDALLAFVREAEANSVLQEVQFTSRLPIIARLRAAWNNIATRWYVRPSLDQQTRYNLALQRALNLFAEQQMTRAAIDALDVALLEWRAENREPRAENREPRTENREPRAENREPRTENREPRTENREPRTES
jgi:GT2 family glycosyltransferase